MKKVSTKKRRLKITDAIRKAYAERDPSQDSADPEAPTLPPEAWEGAIVGKYYRPLKKPIALRLDADVLAWLKSQGAGYQGRINGILRERMMEQRGR